MKRWVRTPYRILGEFGLDGVKFVRAVRSLPSYVSDFLALKKQSRAEQEGTFGFGPPYPCLSDRYADSGTAKGHYFHQDLLVASRIHAMRPAVHIDVGSRVDGFVAHVASFREIVVMDIRDNPEKIRNITFRQANFTEPLPPDLAESCDSASCLHALEHFGLGRYGDPVQWDGYRVGLDNLTAMLKRHGTLYISVPIGPQRIEYNAHRVFSVGYLLDLFSASYATRSVSYVDDDGRLHENVSLEDAAVRDSFGCWYGCGIFELEKR